MTCSGLSLRRKKENSEQKKYNFICGEIQQKNELEPSECWSEQNPFCSHCARVLQPFGRGMVTVVVPQLRRGENMLFLWHLGNTREPVHTFVGHTDVVLAFQWTKPASGRTLVSIWRR